MNGNQLCLGDFYALDRNPSKVVEGSLGGNRFSASVGIANYGERLAKHYRELLPNGLKRQCQQVAIPFHFTHFGLRFQFHDAGELKIYDRGMNLEKEFRDLVNHFGPIFISNQYLDPVGRKDGHRNRFPHLNFHVDRGEHQPTPFSLFFRDPFDEVQKHPRDASTLFLPNITVYLQAVKESSYIGKGTPAHQFLFQKEYVPDLITELILEQPWNAPRGTGEIAILDNRTVLHASYYRTAARDAYRIGVRYVK